MLYSFNWLDFITKRKYVNLIFLVYFKYLILLYFIYEVEILKKTNNKAIFNIDEEGIIKYRRIYSKMYK